MPFTKGHTIRLGQKNTIEQNQHIREAHLRRKELLGYVHTPESKRKLSLALKGRKLSLEHRQKIGESNRRYYLKVGTKKPNCLTCGKQLANYKAKFCVTHKGKKGEAHYNWQGGKTNTGQAIRTSRRYINWRNKVYRRDDYTCQDCKEKGGKLHAHHIKQFSYYPELRFNINNGITLCESCHRKTSTFGSPKKELQNA